MRFKLYEMTGNKPVHEGVLSSEEAPPVVLWGSRVFLLSGQRTEGKAKGGHVVGNYVETDAHQIGLPR